MNFNEYLSDSKTAKLSRRSTTFTASYDFWLNNLFERAMKLFEEDTQDMIAPKHIEMPVMGRGHCFITDKAFGHLTAFNGEFAGGRTEYFDEFDSYSVFSPKYSNIFKMDEGVLISNNSLRTPLYALFHRYAIMLGHVDVTLINALIELRNQNGVGVASTESARQSLENYRNNLCEGKVVPVTDPAFSTIDFKSISRTNSGTIKDLIETRENLLNSFYNDIGVRTSWNKKGNMIVEEVRGNDEMLLLNIKDMLYFRKLGFDAVNEKYGTNWTVEVAKEIQIVADKETDNEQDDNTRPMEEDEN